jgi:hypothetical protein
MPMTVVEVRDRQLLFHPYIHHHCRIALTISTSLPMAVKHSYNPCMTDPTFLVEHWPGVKLKTESFSSTTNKTFGSWNSRGKGMPCHADQASTNRPE